MAMASGEERLVTLFADVHYIFTTSTSSSRPYRFDKASYVYLWGPQSPRVEIANHAGTPEQDAFSGSLGRTTRVVYEGGRQPSVVRVLVGDEHDGVDSAEWMLPLPSSFNSSEGGGGVTRAPLRRLHEVEMYFWTVSDAERFVKAAHGLLGHDQVVVSGPLAAILSPESTDSRHAKAMSPVVQRLENVAVRDEHVANAVATSSSAPEVYQPLAYNPAAPAAPEPIKHREKTPPPVDADTGTGLAAAAYADTQPYTPGKVTRPSFGPHAPSSSYVGVPPPPPSGQGSGYVGGGGGAVPSATAPRTSSFSSSIASSSQSPHVGSSNQQLVPLHQQSPSTPHASPSSQIVGSSFHGNGSAHQPLQHVQPQYADYLSTTGHASPGPVSGHMNHQPTPPNSQVQYSPIPQTTVPNPYDIHQQVYIPSEEDAPKHSSKPSAGADPKGPTGRLEYGAARVDKGVNRFLKKLEKKIG